MKKLFSLILMALISSQMWAADSYTKVFIVGINGSTYTKSTTQGTYGTISCSDAKAFEWSTASGYNCYKVTTTGNTVKFTLVPSAASGYRFKGWYDGQYSSSKQKSTSTSYNTDRSTWSGTIYAHFEVATYTISISSENTTKGTVSASPTTVTHGSSSTFTASPKSGYEFDGWYENNSKISGSNPYTLSNITSNRTIVGKFKAASNVTVAVALADDCTGMGTVSGGTTVASGTSVTITASANSNYYFKGWSTTANGSNIVSTSTSYAVSASNTTYYAVFAAYKTSTISPTGSSSHTAWNTPVSIAGGVDLGLPSGLIWADKNVGAANPGEYGSYFAWGETVAMTSVPSAGTYGFQGHDDMNTLTAAYDAATVNLGNGWRMPTRAEFQELIDHAEWSAGTYRWNVSGNNNTINFPFCGHISTQYPANNTNFGRYWTSDKFSGSGSMKRPYYVDFQSNYTYSIKYDNSDLSTNCWVGYSVRAVHAGATAYTLTIRAKVGDDIVVTNTYRCDNGEKVKITVNTPSGYNFVNWADNSSTATTREFTVAGDAAYTVNYTPSITYVTATFNNYNGTQLAQYTNVVSGTTPTYSGVTPTRPNDQTESTVTTYEFTGWSPALGNITTNTTYTAQFSSSTTPRTYTIRFFMEAGDETPIQTISAAYNETPVCTASVTKPSDTYWTYEFYGWDGNNDGVADGVSAVTGDKDYVAVFTKTSTGVIPNHNVTIGAATNGYVTLTPNTNSITVTVPAAGETYQYPEGTNIIVEAVPARGYHFTQWSDASTAKRRLISEIETDWSLTPTFAANTPFDMLDTWTQAQCGTEYDFDHVLTVTLVGRTFTAGQWATLSVPFDYTLTADDALYNTIYKFTNVTLSSGGSSVYLEFVRTNDIEKNEPYLVVPRQAGINEVVFDGVKLETPAAISLTTDDRVAFVSSLWQQEISGPNDFYIGKLSTLYYAPNSGMTIKGNRAFFHKITSSAPRRAIVVIDGEEREVEIADGNIEEVQNVRKYMENGVLIIERNGVRFNAQGQR